jgi:hypothetical protein
MLNREAREREEIADKYRSNVQKANKTRLKKIKEQKGIEQE